MLNNELLKSFIRQIALYLNRKGISNTISEDGNSELSVAWIELTNYLDRRITSEPRTIHKSLEFDKSVELIPHEYQIKLNTIIDKIAKGEDVNSHLTIQLFQSESFDMLLNHWNIKHLHISDTVETNKSSMRNNRSGFLLFAVIEKADAYLLEAKAHPHGSGFTAYHFLEILHKNGWMNIANFLINKEVVNAQSQVKSDEDIYNLYKNKMNTLFLFDGVCYMTSGVTRHGNKVNRSIEIHKLKQILSNMPKGTTCNSHIENHDKLEFVFSCENKEIRRLFL